MKANFNLSRREAGVKKGGIYGAGRARRGGGQAAGLNQSGDSSTGRGPQPASGVSPKPVGRPRVSLKRRRAVQRAASLRYWRRVRAERAALGLNSRGGIPQKRKWSLTFRGNELHGVRRKTKRQQLMREQHYAAGLTSLGTKPQRANAKRGLVLLTPLEHQYRQLRATMIVPAVLNFESVNSGCIER